MAAEPSAEIHSARTRWAVVALGLAAYIAACAAPALGFESVERASEPARVMKGFEAALLGWQAVFVGNLGWMANPLLFLSLLLILLRAWKMAAIFATLGLLCALHSLALLGERIIADEGGVTHMVMSELHSGFYLWLASLLIAVAGSLWWWQRDRRPVSRL